MRKYLLPAAMAIILLACAALVMRAATSMDTKVKVDEIKGGEYERFIWRQRKALVGKKTGPTQSLWTIPW